MFKFHEGQSVALLEDKLHVGLKAGDTGVVWAAYATDPPAYEVTFCGVSKNAFDMSVLEEEIVATESSHQEQILKSSERTYEAA